jgi:hypothetical protein
VSLSLSKAILITPASIFARNTELEPFKQLTVLLQSHATNGSHGSVWETLPALELLGHVEQAKAQLTEEDTPLAISMNNCWLKLRKHYSETDGNYEIYVIATLLNSVLRKRYFEDYWDGQISRFIGRMQDGCWTHWKEDYFSKAQPVIASQNRPQSLLSTYANQLIIRRVRSILQSSVHCLGPQHRRLVVG